MDYIDLTTLDTIKTLEELKKIYDEPTENTITKQKEFLIQPAYEFIEQSSFLIMATANKDGIDCSPKGDAPGFVQILDDKTILIPDRPGNNRIDGMKNLIINPKIGLIFFIPGSDTTFRVNGSAKISVNPSLLERFLVGGKTPRSVIIVTVEEAFHHCPKAFVRAKLWKAAADNGEKELPTIGSFAAFRDSGDQDYVKRYNADYKKRMELY